MMYLNFPYPVSVLLYSNPSNKRCLQSGFRDSNIKKYLQPHVPQYRLTQFENSIFPANVKAKHAPYFYASIQSKHPTKYQEPHRERIPSKASLNTNLDRWSSCREQRSENSSRHTYGDTVKSTADFASMRYNKSRKFPMELDRSQKDEKSKMQEMMHYLGEVNQDLNGLADLLSHQTKGYHGKKIQAQDKQLKVLDRETNELKQQIKNFQETLDSFNERIKRHHLERQNVFPTKEQLKNYQNLIHSAFNKQAAYKENKATQTKARNADNIENKFDRLRQYTEESREKIRAIEGRFKIAISEESSNKFISSKNSKEALYEKRSASSRSELQFLPQKPKAAPEQKERKKRSIKLVENNQKYEENDLLPSKFSWEPIYRKQPWTKENSLRSDHLDSIEKLDKEYECLIKEFATIARCKNMKKIHELPRDTKNYVQKHNSIKDGNGVLGKDVFEREQIMNDMKDYYKRLLLKNQENVGQLLSQIQLLWEQIKMIPRENRGKINALKAMLESALKEEDDLRKNFFNVELELKNVYNQIQGFNRRLQNRHLESIEDIPSCPSIEMARNYPRNLNDYITNARRLLSERSPRLMESISNQKQQDDAISRHIGKAETMKDNGRELFTSSLKTIANDRFRKVAPDFRDSRFPELGMHRKELKDTKINMKKQRQILTRPSSSSSSSSESLTDLKSIETPLHESCSEEHALFHRITFRDEDEDPGFHKSHWSYRHLSLAHAPIKEKDNIFTERHTASANAILMRVHHKGHSDTTLETSSSSSSGQEQAHYLFLPHMSGSEFDTTISEEELKIKLERTYSLQKLKALIIHQTPRLHALHQDRKPKKLFMDKSLTSLQLRELHDPKKKTLSIGRTPSTKSELNEVKGDDDGAMARDDSSSLIDNYLEKEKPLKSRSDSLLDIPAAHATTKNVSSASSIETAILVTTKVSDALKSSSSGFLIKNEKDLV